MQSTATVFEAISIKDRKLMDPDEFPNNNLGFKRGFGDDWTDRFMSEENLMDIRGPGRD